MGESERRAASVAGELRMGAWECQTLKNHFAMMRLDAAAGESERAKRGAMAVLDRLKREAPWRGMRLEEGYPYRMEGEIGEWTFSTWRVVDDASGKAVHDTRWSLPAQSGKARYRTSECRDLTIFLGISAHSSCAAAALLSRIRHQDDEGSAVAATTARDFTEAEEMAMEKALAEAVAEALRRLPPAPPPLPSPPPPLFNDCVEKAFAEAGVPPELLGEARANTSAPTPPDSTVRVAPDGVSCKKQKLIRKPGKSAMEEKPARERKTVSTACATVEFQKKRITLAARGYDALCSAVLATLCANGLHGMHIGRQNFPIYRFRVSHRGTEARRILI